MQHTHNTDSVLVLEQKTLNGRTESQAHRIMMLTFQKYACMRTGVHIFGAVVAVKIKLASASVLLSNIVFLAVSSMSKHAQVNCTSVQEGNHPSELGWAHSHSNIFTSWEKDYHVNPQIS